MYGLRVRVKTGNKPAVTACNVTEIRWITGHGKGPGRVMITSSFHNRLFVRDANNTVISDVSADTEFAANIWRQQ